MTLRTAALILACTIGLGISAAAENATRSEVYSVFAALVGARSPGMVVVVRQNGRTVFQAGCGVRDLHSLAKIDRDTNFRLASCTKQFTAMATMLLVHDGKLRYDERLTEVFPDFPEYGRAITVRHLLTHTCGLPDYEELMGPNWMLVHQIRDEEVLTLLKQAGPKFAPGASWAYSNSAYVLLGLIVAKVSQEPFAQFLHDRIFRPLHMTHTLAYVKGRTSVPMRAYGHTREGEQFIETDQSPTSATLGDGGVYSNLRDLAKWDAALTSHALLSEEETKVAFMPAKLSDGSEPRDNLNQGKPVSYGFGWFLDPYQGHARMWHTGTTMGFRTVIERFTAEKLTVIVLCNRTDLDPGKLALEAADVFLQAR